jgi:hypothetical protein
MTRATRQDQSEKLHGDELENVVETAGDHREAQPHTALPLRPTRQSQQNSAIPAPEDGGHPLSSAAHLGNRPHDHTKPIGDMRHYELEREPPQEVSRAGKDYRRQ